jgi:hypothetical protein
MGEGHPFLEGGTVLGRAVALVSLLDRRAFCAVPLAKLTFPSRHHLLGDNRMVQAPVIARDESPQSVAAMFSEGSCVSPEAAELRQHCVVVR